jgi:hypothetical protein
MMDKVNNPIIGEKKCNPLPNSFIYGTVARYFLIHDYKFLHQSGMQKPINFTLHDNALDRVRYCVSTSEMLRSGQPSPSFLAFLCEKGTSEALWALLKSHFSSARGTAEEALEHAVKRVNESSAGDVAQKFGALIAVAVDATMFAVASGGPASAYVHTHERFIDVSPDRTVFVREKPFAALTAGAHAGEALLLSLSKVSAHELAQESLRIAYMPAEACGLYDGVRIIGQSATSIAATLAHIPRRMVIWVQERYQRISIKKIWEAGFAIVKNPRASIASFSASAAKMLVQVVRSTTTYTIGLSRRKRAYYLGGFVVTAVLLHVFLTALGAKNFDNITAETLAREERITQLIAQQQDLQALALLDDTLALLARAPARLNAAQHDTLETLRMKVLRTAASLNKVSIIPSPEPVVSMERSFAEKRSFDLSGLALSHGKLYTVNRAEREIYELDGRERRIIVLRDFPEGSGTPTGIAAAVPGYVYIITENPRGILALDASTRAFSFAPLTLPRTDALPLAFAAFHERMYMLDARTRAVYRYEVTPEGFQLWSPWSDEDTLDFSQATTFAVDGSIYITFSDHDIVRLVQGKRLPFSIDAIRPPLERVTAIATKEDSPFLYLLDPPQRRVVIIEKENGSLVAQYTSPLFTDLRGVFPDETAKRVYLLNGDTIYSVGPDDKSIIDE